MFRLVWVVFISGFLMLTVSCAPPRPSYTDYTDIDTTYPEQNPIGDDVHTIIIESGKNTYYLHPKAEYRVGAVVARRKRYYFDKMAKLSPIDLALFWGIMASPSYRNQMRITQNSRRYHFFLKRDAQVSVEWVYLNSSNNHLIPANDNIRRALHRVRKKDVIMLEGYLVNVQTNIRGRSLNWNTSLKRDDRGDGACEIIYVTKLKRNYQVYE